MEALIAVELAEVACLNGDWADATLEAKRALALTGDDVSQCATALRARNTMGKLLLAQSSWAWYSASVSKSHAMYQPSGFALR